MSGDMDTGDMDKSNKDIDKSGMDIVKSNIDIIIRKFKQDDMDTILDIAIAAWTPIYKGYCEILGDEIFNVAFANWQERKKKDIEKACKGFDNCITYVVEIDNKVTGFISFYIDSSTGMGTIGNNAVHPSYQGLGIGRKMYHFVFEQFRKHGMKCATVITGGDKAHLPARKAYEKAGFSSHLETVRYYCKL
jgi:ribosomal protein S18 acetylase RimI-like enzyme